VSALRNARATRGIHEPLELLLSDLSASAPNSAALTETTESGVLTHRYRGETMT
jgi:hypothetical protein